MRRQINFINLFLGLILISAQGGLLKRKAPARQMGCGCSLFSALYSVAPNVVARIPLKDRALIEDAMPSDLREFSAHIILEEEILGPYMTDDEFSRLVSDHEYFKRNRNDKKGWAAHGEWEKAIFSRISSGKRVKRR